jgi:DNA-binding NtrC family response regulator
VPKTILLVEDEPTIAFVLEDAFAGVGFNVIAASTGFDAIEALENKAPQLSALVTDIGLGNGPDGWHIGWRARELRPSLPVLYMSGDCAADWPAKAVPDSRMLAKPFDLDDMVDMVSRLTMAFREPRELTRYFFNVIANGKTIRDLEGTELPNIDAARTEALKDIRSLMSAAVLEGLDISERVMEVCDDAGDVALSIAFSRAITRQA